MSATCTQTEPVTCDHSKNENSNYKKWDQRHCDDFIKNISINDINKLYLSLEPSENSINEVTFQIAELLVKSAKASFKNKKLVNRKSNKAFFGPKCHVARKLYHNARKVYRRHRNWSNRSLLLQSSKNYKKTMDFYINTQKQSNEKRLRDIHSSRPKEYWRYLNSLKTKNNVKMPPLDAFHIYFKDVNRSKYDDTFDFETSDFHISESDDILNSPITDFEISKAIRDLKLGKAAGHDEILNEYFKNAKDILLPLLVKLFNIIFETGMLPSSWLYGRIRPIFKNKGDSSNPENYRPITILSCFSKLFTSVLNNRLTTFIDTYEILQENQAGFRKAYSTTDHIFTLNSLLELFKSYKKKLYCAFIDFSQAFDSVWRIGLWRKLLQNNINGKFFRIVHNMYNGIKSCVSLNGESSPFFACDCGVRQGENLSPVMFSLYLNDLETFLIHKGLSGVTLAITDDEVMIYIKLFSLLYADDTALMADSPTGLQNCLDAFSCYCNQWKLNVNIAKTKVVIFGARKKPKVQFNIGNQEIEIVDSYKYLGVLFTQTCSFLRARKHIVQQAKKAMILLFTRINNLDIPIDLQLKLFDHTVVPILTYACEVWGYENLDMIEKVQNDFLRRITCSKKCTPLYMLYGELGRYPLEITIKSRMIGFWYRITHGNPLKLSSVLYQCLLHSSNINSKWLTCIKSIFTKIGRPDIWQSQQNFHLKSVSFLVKKILIDQYMQDWYSKSSQSSRALTYFSFKQDYVLERYFILLPRKLYQQIFKIRTSNHKLPIETGRWDDIEISERKCPLCHTNDRGDEYHYLLRCPYFEAERKLYLKPYFIRRPNMLKLGELLSSSNVIILSKLSKFLQSIFKLFQ